MSSEPSGDAPEPDRPPASERERLSEPQTTTGGKPRSTVRGRIIKSLALAVVAVALGVASVLLYDWSSPSEAPAPEYPTLTIDTDVPAEIIGYTVDAQSAELKVSVELPSPANFAFAGQAGMATLTLPNAAQFLACRDVICTTRLGAASLTSHPQPQQQQPLIVQTRSRPLVAVADFPLGSADFGVMSNGVTAAVALPQVFYQGQAASGTAGPTLEAQYSIPSAGSYDWSALPPEFAKGNQAWWFETLDNNEVAGRAAVGVDHASQADDDRKIFAAGALVGLAGGALLWAVQEAFRSD